jgi:hypothetical protein
MKRFLPRERKTTPNASCISITSNVVFVVLVNKLFNRDALPDQQRQLYTFFHSFLQHFLIKMASISHQSHRGPPRHDDRSYVSARTGYTDNASRADRSYAPRMIAQPQPAPEAPFYRVMGCIECYNPKRELLEYDYTYDDVNGKKPPQSYPRIRERGEYYLDSFNAESWSCSFGTAEKVRHFLKVCCCHLIYDLEILTVFFNFREHLEWSLV